MHGRMPYKCRMMRIHYMQVLYNTLWLMCFHGVGCINVVWLWWIPQIQTRLKGNGGFHSCCCNGLVSGLPEWVLISSPIIAMRLWVAGGSGSALVPLQTTTNATTTTTACIGAVVEPLCVWQAPWDWGNPELNVCKCKISCLQWERSTHPL